jgi:5,10-methylenetetrahydromethanopterin reductase
MVDLDRLRFAVRFNSDQGSAHQIVKLAMLAEKSGFDCVWYCHDLFKRHAWTVLSAIAANTKRVRVGPAIVNPYTANPAEIAMAIATLDEVSSGRAVLGIGAGALEFFSWIGLETKRPLTRTRETVQIVRNLIEDRRVSFRGKEFSCWTRQAYMRFKPPRGKIPIYVGAHGFKMLELIGEIGDGGLPSLFPPEFAVRAVESITRGARKVGREICEIDISGCIWFSLSDDVDEAKEALRGLVAYYGPQLAPVMIREIGLRPADFDPIRDATRNGDFEKAKALVTERMMRLAVFGSPEECIRRLEELDRRGISQVNIGPPLGPRPEEALRRIGSEIIPSFLDGE